MKRTLFSSDTSSSNRLLALALLALLVVSAGCIGSLEQSTEATTTNPTAAVNFTTQTTNGQTVTVQSVFLPEGGYVAIYKANKQHNIPDATVIGVSEYLKPGTYKNVQVKLYKLPGVPFKRNQLHENQTLTAVPHRETTGNHRFGFFNRGGTVDEPYATNEGTILDSAFIMVTGHANATTTRTNTTATTTS